MTEFRKELAELVARASALPAAEILHALNDECEVQRGTLICEQLDRGTWPPDDPAHFAESDRTAASRG